MARWIKLDMDWYDDPKILEFRELYGKAALVDVIKLFCALGEFWGQVDLNERAQRLHLRKVLGKTDKSLATFLGRCAEVGLINKEAYQEFGRVGSERSIRDGESRQRRRDRALDGANKRWAQEDDPGGSDPDESNAQGNAPSIPSSNAMPIIREREREREKSVAGLHR